MHRFFLDDSGFSKFKLATIGAFHTLVYHAIPDRFPGVRWGFIEVSSQWVPYVLNDLSIRFRRRGKELGGDVLRRNNIWVACQVTDDLPYVLGYTGEDHVVIGTDYGHADTATEIEALRLLKTDGRVEPRVVDKILDDNARAFYGLGRRWRTIRRRGFAAAPREKGSKKGPSPLPPLVARDSAVSLRDDCQWRRRCVLR